MDMIYTLLCGLLVVSLSLYAKPFTTVQYKSTKTLPAAGSRSALNRSRAAKEPPDLDAKTGAKQRPSSGDQSRKKQPPKNRDKRKNCFGLKMDRISDVSGMGCKSD
nr:C-type natriuretic peptide-4 like [Danio rerio]